MSLAASSPMIWPDLKSSTPQKAIRLERGASESHVTTGMPASMARLMGSLSRSALVHEIAMPSTPWVMNDSRISFCLSGSASSGARQITSTLPSCLAALSAPVRE